MMLKFHPNFAFICYYWLSVLRLCASLCGLVASGICLHKVVDGEYHFDDQFTWIRVVIMCSLLMGVQGAISLLTSATACAASVILFGFLKSIVQNMIYFYGDVMITWIVSSLGLLLIMTWAALVCPTEVETKGSLVSLLKLCSKNTKDLLILVPKGPERPTPHLRGHNRLAQNSINITGVLPLGALISPILFRRVKHVESKKFAFFQNFCAILGLGVIIYVTITGLLGANTKFETRSYTKDCTESETNMQDITDIQVIMQSWFDSYDGLWTPNPNTSITVSISNEQTPPKACNWQNLSQTYIPVNSPDLKLAGYDVFSCDYPEGPESLISYDVSIQSLRGLPLLSRDISNVWMSNRLQFPNKLWTNNDSNSGFDGVMMSATPLYTPNWAPVPGYHIEAQMGFISRRFITSSIFKDLIFRQEPVRHIKQYPYTQFVDTMATAPLANKTIATARIIANFQQTFSYLSTGDIFRSVNHPWVYGPGTCDFVDDYRSNTVFDAIGSIGGLFALIQSMHLLLFGKPLLWTLTGAKTITPFGLLGAIRSKDLNFRKSLRAHYRQPNEPNSDHQSKFDRQSPLDLERFLGDFIIDFGPASVSPADSDHQPVPTPGTDPSELKAMPTLRCDTV